MSSIPQCGYPIAALKRRCYLRIGLSLQLAAPSLVTAPFHPSKPAPPVFHHRTLTLSSRTNSPVSPAAPPISNMTTTAAQDEFNELMRDKDRESRHPDDRHDDSDISDSASAGAAEDYLEKIDTDDEIDLPANMRSNYYMPSHIRSEANTGPKGVIADAQAFEQAKKQARRFTWKKSPPPTQYSVNAWHEKDVSSDEDNEDSFMKEWRAARLRELQNVGQRIRSRTNSPSRRIYGNFPLVDAEGYLDALDKSSPETTVVVYIYNHHVSSGQSSLPLS